MLQFKMKFNYSPDEIIDAKNASQLVEVLYRRYGIDNCIKVCNEHFIIGLICPGPGSGYKFEWWNSPSDGRHPILSDFFDPEGDCSTNYNDKYSENLPKDSCLIVSYDDDY